MNLRAALPLPAFAVVLCVLVAACATCTADTIATLAPPLEWSFASPQKLQLSEQPDGGPAGAAWTEVTYAPGASANLRTRVPLALPPGAVLKVWVKGNGTSDSLYLYLFGGAGHRSYSLPLSGTG
jgi:hypothetical protein